jgi:hypothetical protein
MNDETKKGADNPLVLIAGYCAGASFGIAAVAFLLLHDFNDGRWWAIAAMVAAPSLMACGIAYFMCNQSRQNGPSSKDDA